VFDSDDTKTCGDYGVSILVYDFGVSAFYSFASSIEDGALSIPDD